MPILLVIRCRLVFDMPLWTVEHRVYVYDMFVKTGESVITTQRRFRRHFNIGRHGEIPNRNTILRWVAAFRTRGSVMKMKPPGPARSARTPENVERVLHAIQRSPRRSARRHAAELGLTKSTVKRILHKDLGFHPYKLLMVQELNARDYEQRLTFAQTMHAMFTENEGLTVIMSDEAHFYLNGIVNKQNYRYWASENPRGLQQRPLHSPKVTVWCGIAKSGIFGPFFFEEHGITVTVNSARYINMFENFFLPELQRRGINRRDAWFQQDGATAHTARASMDVIRAAFPNRVISRFGDVSWPPRSPDLSMCDFYLWGYLKSRVYDGMPRTLEQLKTAIRDRIEEINLVTLERVEANYRERLQACVRENGHHLHDIIFRT